MVAVGGDLLVDFGEAVLDGVELAVGVVGLVFLGVDFDALLKFGEDGAYLRAQGHVARRTPAEHGDDLVEVVVALHLGSVFGQELVYGVDPLRLGLLGDHALLDGLGLGEEKRRVVRGRCLRGVEYLNLLVVGCCHFKIVLTKNDFK